MGMWKGRYGEILLFACERKMEVRAACTPAGGLDRLEIFGSFIPSDTVACHHCCPAFPLLRVALVVTGVSRRRIVTTDVRALQYNFSNSSRVFAGKEFS